MKSNGLLLINKHCKSLTHVALCFRNILLYIFLNQSALKNQARKVCLSLETGPYEM